LRLGLSTRIATGYDADVHQHPAAQRLHSHLNAVDEDVLMVIISRRRVLQLAAATGVETVSPFHCVYAHPDGYQTALPSVIDSSENLTRAAVTLKERGVKVVIRYYALENNLPEKIITKSEAKAIMDAGLSLAISYQYHNDDIGTFETGRANQDADKCVELADEIGQPGNTAIYFGVDGDWVRKEETDSIAEYFTALKNHPRFTKRGLQAGVYGSGFTCNWLGMRGLAHFFGSQA
jgi:hypothetical protein